MPRTGVGWAGHTGTPPHPERSQHNSITNQKKINQRTHIQAKISFLKIITVVWGASPLQSLWTMTPLLTKFKKFYRQGLVNCNKLKSSKSVPYERAPKSENSKVPALLPLLIML